MTRYLLSLLLATYSLATLSAPVCVDPEQPVKNQPARSGVGDIGSPQNGGIGGTGSPEHGGIGGTGAPAVGGIGGTGAPLADGATVGIVGVVSGFASVCVNGLEVHFDHGVPVNENGDPSSVDKLAVGQVISIDASNSPKGLKARNIAILNALEGPITDLPGGGKAIQVLGQNVLIGPNTRGQSQGLAIGQIVKVSALSGANGTLIATRVQPSPGLTRVSALGTVVSSGKQSLVNGVAVAGSVNRATALVTGQWDGNALIPTSVKVDPTYRFRKTASRILIEGLVQKSDGRGNITAGGVELSVPKATARQMNALYPNQRVFVEAEVKHSGRLVVDHLEMSDTERRQSRPTNRTEQQGRVSADRENSPEVARKSEKSETVEKIEQIEKFEKAEKAEKAERIEKAEKAEKIERIEKIEKIERVEKPEKIERAEKVELPERH